MTDRSRDLSRSTVKVKKVSGASFASNIYLVQADENFIVDTGMGRVKDIIDHIEEEDIDIQRIILTHRHYDHVGGAKKLSKALDAPLYAHRLAADALRKGDDETILASEFGHEMPKLDVNDLDEETYTGFLIIHTPGHSEGSISLYHGGEKILMSGDTVFSGGGAGRTDLPTGSMSELKESLEKLTGYDVHSLYPGHGPEIIGRGNEHIELTLKNLTYL